MAKKKSTQKRKRTLKPKYRHKTYFLIAFVLIIILFGGIFLFSENKKLVTTTSSSVNPTVTDFPTPTTPQNLIIKTYTSPVLGITFTYVPDYPGGQSNIVASEEGNKACVYYKDYKFNGCQDEHGYTGQSVEIFSKNPQQSLQEVIEEKYLKNYSRKDCFVEDLTSKFAENNPYGEVKVISWPPDGPNVTYMENSFKCPEHYSKSNGLSYFMADKRFPDKYAFFFIGQYKIYGNEKDGWEKTFQFIK